MSQNEEPTGEAKFDVFAKVPQGTKLEDIARQAASAGIPFDRMDVLLKALRNLPQVQIGKAVVRQRADAAKALYEKSGLQIVITPVLALEGLTTTEEIACPACRERVLLSPQRQCPRCGVFVDKFTDEYMQKRRQAELDRAAIRRELEDEFNLKLEAALVKELRKRGVFKGSAGAVRAAVLVGLLGVAFVVGRSSLLGFSPDAMMAVFSGGKSTLLLDTAFPAPAGAGGGQPAAPAASADVAAAAVDADDPLLSRSPRGGKQISIEQAVAASRVLARSVGNTVADRALADVPIPPGTEPVTVPAPVKVALGVDLARQLAGMGQPARAQKLMQGLDARARPDPVLAAEAQAAALEIRAWSIGAMDPAQARAAAKALLADADRIADVPRRVQALTQAGIALSLQPQLPREAARALLTRASEVLAGVSVPEQRERAAIGWATGLGQVLLNESSVAARAGRWAMVRANSAQLQALSQQAPAPAQPALFAMASQLQSMAGDAEGAQRSLDAALSRAAAVPALGDRATVLRAIISGAGGIGDKTGTALDALQAQALSKGGLDGGRALVELALAYSESGLRGKAQEAAQAARRVQGLTPAEAVILHADLAARTDLATARMLQVMGQYGEAEALVQRVGGYAQ